jgi:hypothetical protein
MMTRSYLLMLGFFLALAIRAQGVNEPDWTEQDRKRESEQAALWVRKLDQAEHLDPNSKFDALWLGLRNMGHRAKIPDHSAAIDQIFGEIQRNLLATPGHAQHFADLIERERAALKPGEYGKFIIVGKFMIEIAIATSARPSAICPAQKPSRYLGITSMMTGTPQLDRKLRPMEVPHPPTRSSQWMR